jgi:thioredoxin-like negative regulator of GroEL
VHLKAGDNTKALQAFDQAVKISPVNVDAMIGLAFTAMKSGDMARANDILNDIEPLIKGRREPLSPEVNLQLEDLRKTVQTSATGAE